VYGVDVKVAPAVRRFALESFLHGPSIPLPLFARP
jgi:hypothetical protein